MPKITLTKLMLYILIPLQLLIFTFLVPPFQKPDEQPHFEKSLLISKGYLFCRKKTNNTVPIEKKYIDFIKTPYLDLLTHGKSKLPIKIFLKDLFSNNQSNVLVNSNIDHLCSFPIISYLPQSYSLMISSILNLNPIMSLYLGRMFMSVLGYFWFLYLYKKINDNHKLILLFTFALPMTLHQISSFSYDAVHIMLGLTFLTLLVNHINMSSLYYFKLFFVLFLFLTSKKIGYETFFLFLFLIPFEIRPMMIGFLILIPAYIFSKLNGSYDLQYSLISLNINPLQQLNFLVSSPINILNILISTTISRFPFYLQSFIGIFGWLEYGLDYFSYLLYGLFFGYVIINIKLINKQILKKNKSILLFVTLIISYVFIVLLAFVFNTTPGTFVAHGVQGRYFIPFVPFIILLLTQIKNNYLKQIKLQPNIIVSALITLYLISATFFSVFNRYY